MPNQESQYPGRLRDLRAAAADQAATGRGVMDETRCGSTDVVQGETIRCEKEAGHDGLHAAVKLGMAFGNPDWVLPFTVQWGDPAPVAPTS